MKKLISITALVFVFLLSFTVVSAAEQVTSTNSGFSNVPFSNDYYGFCIDANLSGAYTGDNFDASDDTSVACNNIDGSDVSQKLKILFTQCFEDIFVPDGNGGYVIDSLKADSSVQSAIWYFTDGRYIWGESKAFVDKVNAYDGPPIPDNGYTLQLGQGDVISFYFTTLQPQKDGQQAFFAYKIAVGQEPTHTHEYSEEWKSDSENHWHECDCSDKTDVAPHKGNEPDCVNPSICEVCGEKFEEVNPDNHTGNTEVRDAKPASEFEDGYTGDTYCSDCDKLLEKGEVIKSTHTHKYGKEWESDSENHWHECDCSDKTDVTPHKGNEPDCVNPSICEVCGEKFEEVNPDNHTGNTEVRDAKPASEFEDGYTGDTYCSDCDKLLEKGEVIKATHTHKYGKEWESDSKNHWHECDCSDKTDVAPHKGNEPDCVNPSICEVCGEKFEEVNPDNHTGNTEVRDAKPVSEFEDGYTGDTYCSDCDKLLEKGEVIKATHTHKYGKEWESDSENHWHECDCSDKTDVAPHKGNEPDCVTPSTCEVCGEKFEEVNPDNHTGNTEVRDAKPASEFEDGYTGDTYCSDCDKLLEKGEVIKVTHTHKYGEEWESDSENHWHECDCSDKIDVESHTFKDGVCSTCEEPDPNFDKDKDTDTDKGTVDDKDNDKNTNTGANTVNGTQTNAGVISTGSSNHYFAFVVLIMSLCILIIAYFLRRKDSAV